LTNISNKKKEMIWVYGKEGCGWCVKAKKFLEDTNREFTYIDLNEPNVLEFLVRRNLKTLPQVFIGDKRIGGYTDLILYFDSDTLPIAEL
jgi:glutaredoxin 1